MSVTKFVRYPAYAAARTAVNLACSVRRRSLEGRPSLYVYTDSRGFLIDRWYCRKNPYLGYAWALGRDFQVWDRICPHQHTTLIDFLFDFEQGRSSGEVPGVDAIVLHTGIVDFSPRAATGAIRLRETKARRVAHLFGEEAVEELFATEEYPEEYGGERTASLYSEVFFKNRVIPAIEALPVPVVWVGTNRVLQDWRGTYFRDRPSNMNRILDFDRWVVDRNVRHCSAQGWTDQEIREYTVDNVHLSTAGFGVVETWIRNELALLNLFEKPRIAEVEG